MNEYMDAIIYRISYMSLLLERTETSYNYRVQFRILMMLNEIIQDSNLK